MIYNILLIILVIFIIYQVLTNEKIKETYGSDFFHRSFMSGLGQEQREEALKKINKFYEEKKEEMTNEENKINPNIISEYPKNEIKPDFDIEEPKFEKEKEEKEEDKYAEYLEVNKYDSGSGDLSKINKVFKDLDKKNYYDSLKSLEKRGGNVY